MNTISNLPYFETEADKLGNLADPTQVRNVLNFLAGPGSAIKDVFVMSHGWKNTILDARSLYARLFTQFSIALDAYAAPGVTPGQAEVIGFLWPSIEFADPTLIPGGASLGSDPGAQREFVDAVRSQLTNRQDEEGQQHLFGIDGDELLQRLRTATLADDPEEGGAAGLGDLAGEIRNAAERFLNTATYYLMKDRAGTVGRGAMARMLGQIQDAFPAVRIHLAGHSFGCRVITAAASANARPVASMTLLQAAFSQNSFSPDFDSTHLPGGFRNVIAERKCAGPILISHTIRDTDVGIAYAVASRLAGQESSAIGDA